MSHDNYIVCKIKCNNVKYTIELDNHKYLNYCNFCDVWFTFENSVSIIYKINNPIFKECGNCRKLELNTTHLIKIFDDKRTRTLKNYLELVNGCGLNNDLCVIIVNYLFYNNIL